MRSRDRKIRSIKKMYGNLDKIFISREVFRMLENLSDDLIEDLMVQIDFFIDELSSMEKLSIIPIFDYNKDIPVLCFVVMSKENDTLPSDIMLMVSYHVGESCFYYKQSPSKFYFVKKEWQEYLRLILGFQPAIDNS